MLFYTEIALASKQLSTVAFLFPFRHAFFVWLQVKVVFPSGGSPTSYDTPPESAGLPKDRADSATASLATGKSGSSASAATDDVEEEDSDGSAANTRPWLFHLVMALGGLYLSMLLTNWGDAGVWVPCVQKRA